MKKNKYPPKRPDKSHIIKFPPKLNWSEYQKDIFKDIGKGQGHTIIEARAGSSKTTSIVEGFRYLPKGKKAIALAFNKNIQEELQSRSPSYIETSTFHSLGLRAIKQRFGAIQLDDNKVFFLAKSLVNEEENSFEIATALSDTVAYCKYGLLDTPKQIDDLIDHFGIDLCEMERENFIKLVIQILSLDKNKTDTIDFNDMCWLPFIHNLFLGQYDYVFVDERQDLNKSQLVMARKACKLNGGRIIATGDSFQELYSWRLSDNSIIEDLKKQEGTKVLPLPISYRCPKKIIELVKNWVSDISCPETAIEGEIKDITLNSLYDIAKPGCFILSRTNAPLIKICMNFIKLGIKANIRGRDVGKQLNYLIRKSKKKKIAAFLKWLENWKNEEVIKLHAKRINPENVLDRYECLANICEDSKNLEEVSKRINELFNDVDDNKIITLSTVHRAKGLESNQVFLLRWTFRTWFDEMEHLEKPNEEANIAYVGATRSKEKLFIVHK